MNWLRNALIAAILAVVYLLFISWNTFQEEATARATEQLHSSSSQQTSVSNADPSAPAQQTAVPQNDDIPIFVPPALPPSSDVPSENALASEIISVQTDSLIVEIDTHGGDIIKVALPKHLTKLGADGQPFILLNRTNAHTYIAQSGLIGPNGTDSAKTGRPIFKSTKQHYELHEHDDQLVVDLFLTQNNGTQITKRFTFSRESYLINIEYIINNLSAQAWSGSLFAQIKRDSSKPPAEYNMSMSPYLGAAITTPETNYKKLDFDSIEDKTFEASIKGGWVAMVQHYFVSAWIPEQNTINQYKLAKVTGRDLYRFGFTSESTLIQPGTQGHIPFSFYAGPKHIKVLEEISPFLDLTIDYSWLWFIAKPLFLGLDFIHGWVSNWGIAIILLTCLIKLVFFYPSAMSYRSMAKMRKVQPQMMELKERYGEDRQKMSTELMKLYQKEKVNPFSGCLPILMQMPVFIALYWVIMESVELRHSPFYFWLTDLSVKDPYFILPLIMGVTMWIQQKLNPTPADPMQAKVMQMMPFFFTFLFMLFPAGLVLYWVVNNTLSIAQQYVITKQIENA